ncbi:MAG: UvrD-helicase domain-containing protein [Acidimicrobiales bacterium]
MDADALLDGLNEEQRVAVTTEAAPLCILAGAGSGKTRVLTRRVAHRAATGSLDPRRVLVLTFTRAAASELVGRLRRLGLRDSLTAGTFHAVAYGQLRRRYAERRVAPPGLLERKIAFVARQLPKGAGVRAIDVATEIEWAKARVIGPSSYAAEATRARRAPAPNVEVVAEAYARYETAKRKAAVVDFDDLLWLAIHAIEHDRDTAATVRWQHQHLFVDEFQDVNPLQFRLLQAWLGQRDDLCVVGDPNQAIYAWNGADPSLLTGFVDHFPGASVVALASNHRSTPQVLTLANRVLDAGGLAGVRLTPTRQEGPDPVVVSSATGDEEAAAIAASLRGHHDHNVAWSHQAVLVRTNALAVVLADTLRGAGIPVRLRAQTPFLELPAIKQAMASLRRRGFLEGLAELGERSSDEPDEERIALGELMRLASEYSAEDPLPSPLGFTGWLATATADDAQQSRDAVVVATFHAAKGLEWPVVHLAALEDGLVPHTRARTPEALDEERRLLYVAITRAERVLRLSWALTRSFGDKDVRRRPSPFLAELAPVLAAMAIGASQVDGRARAVDAVDFVRAVRSSANATALAPLAVALAGWRDRRARASGMTPSGVLDDSSLEEISTQRPVDEHGLAAIVGPVRAPRLARELLPIIAAHGDVSSSDRRA